MRPGSGGAAGLHTAASCEQVGGGPGLDLGVYVGSTSLATDEDDPYIIKIGADGAVEWTRVIPMEGVNHTLTGEQTPTAATF